MRRVVSSREVPHLWMHNREPNDHARNGTGSISFCGPRAYSYSTCVANHVRREDGLEAVLWDNRHYSVTTTCHVAKFRSAARHIVLQFHVPNVAAHGGFRDADHAANLAEYAQTVRGLFQKWRRSRKHQAAVAAVVLDTIHEANAYADFFGLSGRIDVPADFNPDEVQSALATYLSDREKAKAEKQRQRLVECQDHIEQWKAGDPDAYIPHDVAAVFLRLGPAKDHIQTSKGVQFPLDHAVRALSFIRRGVPYEHNGHAIHIGHYRIDRIDADGNVTAGCHYITRQEIERIAAQLSV